MEKMINLKRMYRCDTNWYRYWYRHGTVYRMVAGKVLKWNFNNS